MNRRSILSTAVCRISATYTLLVFGFCLTTGRSRQPATSVTAVAAATSSAPAERSQPERGFPVIALRFSIIERTPDVADSSTELREATHPNGGLARDPARTPATAWQG
jgi:hypothetical protein